MVNKIFSVKLFQYGFFLLLFFCIGKILNAQTPVITSDSLKDAFKTFVQDTTVSSPASPVKVTASSSLESQLLQLLAKPEIIAKFRGPQGPQGPAGKDGQNGANGSSGSSSSYNSGDFVTWEAMEGQIDKILEGAIENPAEGLANRLDTSITTVNLTVSGNTEISGTLNVSGVITGNVNGLLNPGFTTGSVTFQGATGLAQDNSNFFWDDTNDRLGIGDTTPTNKLDVAGSVGISDVTVIDASRNLTNIGTITSGLINGQTISSSANLTGTLSVATSLSINSGTALTTTNQTGTGSLVLATSPTLTTPALGAATYTTLAGGAITNSSLTSGRVTFASTGGLMADDADLTFFTDTLSATKLLSSTSVSTPSLISTGAITMTPGAGTNLNINLSATGDLAVNTDDLYVDTSSGFVGIGTTSPGAILESKLSGVTGDGLIIRANGAGAGTEAPALAFAYNSGILGRVTNTYDSTYASWGFTFSNIGGLPMLRVDRTSAGGTSRLRLTGSASSFNSSITDLEFFESSLSSPAKIRAILQSGSNIDLAFEPLSGGTPTERMRIEAGGDVGIGTTNPTSKLHLVGTSDQIQTIIKGYSSQTANLQEWQNSSAVVGARVNAATEFSNTKGKVESETFGDGTTMSGIGSLVLGYQASGSANYITALGRSASAAAVSAVAIGHSSLAAGQAAVSIGQTSSVHGPYGIGIGYNNTVGGSHNGSMALGRGLVTSAAGQLLIGSNTDSYEINDVYIGKGITHITPTAFTINATGGSGTDIAGADIRIAGGKGTGNAAGGDILFQTSNAGSSGTTLQSLTTKMAINELGNVGIGTTTVSAKLHSLATTEQLRLGYDASNYLSAVVNSTGGTTLTFGGAGGGLTINGENDGAILGVLDIKGASGGTELFRAYNATNTKMFSITSDGVPTVAATNFFASAHSSKIGDPNQLITGGGTGLAITTSGGLWIDVGGGTTGNIVVLTDGSTGINDTSPDATLDVETTSGLITIFNSTATNGGYSTIQRSGTSRLYYGIELALRGAGTNNNAIVAGPHSGDSGYLVLYGNYNEANSGLYLQNGALAPTVNNVMQLGQNGARWSEVYATNGTINTSDARFKTNVEDSTLGLEFINALRPVSYRWIENDNGIHYGLIAQEVGVLAPELLRGSEEDGYGLAYTEFVGPIIKAIQELSSQVVEFKNEVLARLVGHDEKIEALEARILELEETLNISSPSNNDEETPPAEEPVVEQPPAEEQPITEEPPAAEEPLVEETPAEETPSPEPLP